MVKNMEVIDFEEARLKKDLLDSYRFYMDHCSERDRNYYEKIVLSPAISKICQKYKNQGIHLSYDSINENMGFFDDLFEEICRSIISLDPIFGGASEEVKRRILDYLEERREMSKEEMLFDDDFYSEKPDISEYEFQIFTIKKDMEDFTKDMMDSQSYGSK